MTQLRGRYADCRPDCTVDCGHCKGTGRPRLMTPREVAAVFRVDPKTVTRWARAGKLASVRTIGGHRRFYAAEVERLLEVVDGGA